jgi:TIR domain
LAVKRLLSLLRQRRWKDGQVRVFISWSNEPSRSIACALGEWLGGLVQAVEPWVSDEEIASGKRWREEIGAALNETDFGIICLTRGNQHNPWLMFEAGALAKHLVSARVIPVYVDLDSAEVTGPLADWQGRKLTAMACGEWFRTSSRRPRSRWRPMH